MIVRKAAGGAAAIFTIVAIAAFQPRSAAAQPYSGVMLLDIVPGGGAGNPQGITAVGDKVFFVAITPAMGPELWVTDGTTAGTQVVAELIPGTSSSKKPTLLTAAGDTLFFVLDDGVHGAELWTSDGTAAGTSMVKDIREGSTGATIKSIVPFGSSAVFDANDGTNGQEPWVSDGTEGGTQLLSDVQPGAGSSSPTELAVAMGKVFFTAFSSAQGTEPRMTDGTSPGTTLLADVNPGFGSSFPKRYVPLGDGLVFSAFASAKVQLVISDGTAGGTAPVGGSTPAGVPDKPIELVSSSGQVFFTASGTGVGSEPWVSDGTAAGTVLLGDLEAGLGSSSPKQFTPFGSKTCFTAHTNAAGTELYCSGGAAGDAAIVANLGANHLSAFPENLTVFDGKLFFSAQADGGNDLWFTDSTEAGTVLVDIAPGAASAAPHDFAILNAGGPSPQLIFAATRSGLGTELFTLCKGCSIDDVCVAIGVTNPANPCEACVADNLTAWSATPSVSCEDGDLCTDGDLCDGTGACVGTPVACAPGGACVTNACDPATGACKLTPLPAGTLCSDGNACTAGDNCVNGACMAGAPTVCPAAPICNTAACNPATGACNNTAVANGTACDDANACTLVDKCNAGACAGTPKVCLKQTCQTESCNAATGACEYTSELNGTACDDNDLCTGSSSCDKGACVGANPVVCPDDPNDCQSPACDPGTGGCVSSSLIDGTACDDGDSCTVTDQCSQGICSGAFCPAPPDLGQCQVMVCTDGNCKVAELLGPCDDNNGCTTGDFCSGGQCVGVATECPDSGNTCKPNICNPDTGGCEAKNANNGVPCDDADKCTKDDVCKDGVCSGNFCPGLTPSGVCSQLVCDVTDGSCEVTKTSDGVPCDDEDLCTLNDVCVDGTCDGEPVDCPLGSDGCHPLICQPSTGQCEEVTLAEGAPCDDDDLCTKNDLCTGGKCNGVFCPGLDTSDPCNQAVCDNTTGACFSNPVTGGACDDGDLCTTGDSCLEGQCTGVAVDCPSDGDACKPVECNPESGVCEELPIGEGEACDDKDLCTKNDVCTGGKCAGVFCPGIKQNGNCLVAICDTTSGECVPSEQDGASCTDGDPCTTDVCKGGVCLSVPLVCPEGPDPCKPNICKPGEGCVATVLEDGVACDDNDLCTKNDVCTEGQCGGVFCPSIQQNGGCLVAICDITTGECVPSEQDGAPCTDGDPCTTDACQGGVCLSVPLVCPEGPDPCKPNICKPGEGCVATVLDDGAPCDDGDLCTKNDVCAANKCAGEFCPGLIQTDPCNQAICDTTTGACTSNPLTGGACDDGDLCTTNDVCVEGSCDGTAVLCPSDGEPCNPIACNPSNGQCEEKPIGEGDGCNDGDLCTKNDVCTAGKCAGEFCPGLSQTDPCNQATCDTTTGVCTANPVTGGACDDGDLCTTNDVCVEGSCDGEPVDCPSDGEPCNPIACNPSNGQCEEKPIGEGESCNDGDLCTKNDVCTSGKCAGEFCPGLSQTDPCNQATCTTTTGVCTANPVTGGACDDGDLCTTKDSCVEGSCVGAAVLCPSDGEPCNPVACNPLNGQCEEKPLAEGATCNDGDLCTKNDVCTAGKCEGEFCPGLSQTDPCNQATCTTTTGVCIANPVTGGACDDGELCTTKDSCVEGSCVGAAVLCPSDDEPCNPVACNPLNGQCEEKPLAEGATCDDGKLCTKDDVCTAGKCAGEYCPGLSQTDPCNQATCDTTTGVCTANPVTGGACDDGDLCTTADSCVEGSCVGAAVMCSSGDEPCKPIACNPLNGQCEAMPIGEGEACDDGDPCTGKDVCTGGKCMGEFCPDFPQSDACSQVTCDTTSGRCEQVFNDGASCSDDDACTENDACSEGACVGAPKSCPPGKDSCHPLVCEPQSGLCFEKVIGPGEACDDGIPCTVDDVCDDESECRGQPKDCTNEDPCVAGTCETATGNCVYTDIESCKDPDPGFVPHTASPSAGMPGPSTVTSGAQNVVVHDVTLSCSTSESFENPTFSFVGLGKAQTILILSGFYDTNNNGIIESGEPEIGSVVPEPNKPIVLPTTAEVPQLEESRFIFTATIGAANGSAQQQTAPIAFVPELPGPSTPSPGLPWLLLVALLGFAILGRLGRTRARRVRTLAAIAVVVSLATAGLSCGGGDDSTAQEDAFSAETVIQLELESVTVTGSESGEEFELVSKPISGVQITVLPAGSR